MIETIATVHVIIPARDEEELLPRCLKALAGAVEHLADVYPRIPVHAVVVADCTTDGTHEIVSGSSLVDLVVVEHGNVGAARRAGIEHLLASVDDPTTVWIATTDADSVVPTDWLTQQIVLAEAGADVVVGSVVPETDGLSAEQWDAWQKFHELPDPTGDIHGANLGIRGSSYVALADSSPARSGKMSTWFNARSQPARPWSVPPGCQLSHPRGQKREPPTGIRRGCIAAA